MKNVFRTKRKPLAAGTLVAVLGGVLLMPAANDASAQTTEVDADFSKYCRTFFPNSGPVKRAPGGVTAHYCNQGGTAQGIDLARACELTTGNRNFRTLGDRVLCEAGPGPADTAAAQPLGAADFVEYCRVAFPNSIYQDVPGNSGSRHHCRRPGASGGFTLQPIDLADACAMLKPGTQYKEEGGRVMCAGDSATGTAERRATVAGNTSATEPSAQSKTGGSTTPQPGSNKSPQAEKPANGPGKELAGPAELWGDWEMRVGTLAGVKIQIIQSGTLLTGTIQSIPASQRAYFRDFTSLAIGDVFFTGKVNGNSFTGRTILGITGSRHFPAGTPCANDIQALRADQSRWPELRATVKAGQLVGRHRGINVWPINGVCRQQPFIDHPPLVKDGWVKFELEKIDACTAVAEKPTLGLFDLLRDRRNRASRSARAQLGGD